MKNQSVQTTLCIPGTWKTRQEVVVSIIQSNPNEFIFAGQLLVNMKTKQMFEMQVHEKSEHIKYAFEWGGKVNQMPVPFIEMVARHEHVVYLISETGSVESAKSLAEAGLAVLKAGGMGVLVETSGKAFTKEHWQILLSDFDAWIAYQMFVVDSILYENGDVYSCGMHNLGLKDTYITGEEFQNSVVLIRSFSSYQLLEQSQILAHQTFSIAANEPVFEILAEPNQPYAGHDFYENPFGMWRLKRK